MSVTLICELAGIIILCLIFLQDMKDRAVSWILFPFLCIVYVIRFLYADGDYIYPIFNYSFVIVQIVSVILYVLLKFKSTKIFTSYLGPGDVLYWMAIAWFFSPLNFIIYHLTGLIFAIAIYFAFLRSGKKTIPLAGLQSLVLIVFTIVSWISPWKNTFDDNYILTLLY